MSLLDDENVLLSTKRDKEIIRAWISDNYYKDDVWGFNSYNGIIKMHISQRKDGLYNVDVYDNISLKSTALSITNNLFNFRWCFGDFNFCRNKNITTIKGCPRFIQGNLNLSGCDKLIQMDDCPGRVGGFVYIENEKINSKFITPMKVKYISSRIVEF